MGGRNYGNSRRLIFNFSGSFALDHVVHWSAEVARFPLEIAVLVELCENDLVCELSSLFTRYLNLGLISTTSYLLRLNFVSARP